MRKLVVALLACGLLGCFAGTGGRAITRTVFWVQVTSDQWNDATVRLMCRGRAFNPPMRAGLNREIIQKYDYAYCTELTATVNILASPVPYKTQPFFALIRPDDVLCVHIYQNINLTEINYCGEDSDM